MHSKLRTYTQTRVHAYCTVFGVTKIVTIFNCLVHNRDIISKREIWSTWKWYLTSIYQIVKHQRRGIMGNTRRKGCKCACVCESPSIPVVSLRSHWTRLSVKDQTVEQVRISLYHWARELEWQFYLWHYILFIIHNWLWNFEVTLSISSCQFPLHDV